MLAQLSPDLPLLGLGSLSSLLPSASCSSVLILVPKVCFVTTDVVPILILELVVISFEGIQPFAGVFDNVLRRQQ